MMEEQPHIVRGTLGNLRGIIHKSAQTTTKGIVILLHGYFTSNKLGPANLYVQIARIFANQGYEFWRFDSYGVGDSDGEFQESTYERRIADYKIIIDCALKQHRNILLLAHSVGTSIAIYLANRYLQNIQTLFLLSPSFGKFTDRLISNDLQELLEKQDFAYRRAQLISNDVVKQISSETVYNEVSKCCAKCILFYGLGDEYYTSSSITRVVQYLKNYMLIEIDEGGHNFLIDRTILFDRIKIEIKKLDEKNNC